VCRQGIRHARRRRALCRGHVRRLWPPAAAADADPTAELDPPEDASCTDSDAVAADTELENSPTTIGSPMPPPRKARRSRARKAPAAEFDVDYVDESGFV
jgi:hypothetical protein